MKYIKLTGSFSDNEVLVNTTGIVALESSPIDVKIHLLGGSTVFVKESIESITKMLKESDHIKITNFYPG